MAGGLLLAVPLLPLPRMFGELREDSAFIGSGEWLLGLAIFGSLAWVLSRALGDRVLRGLERIPARFAVTERRWPVLALGASLAAILLAVSHGVFEHRPLLVDGVTQLFQAKIFATGHASAPAPVLPEFFLTPQMIVADGRWYSQYPPGHAALLAIGVVAGVPWLVPVVLSLAAAGFLYGFARRAYDRPTARVTLLLLVLSPFFFFMGASFMSHVSSLVAVCGLLYFFARWEETRRVAFLAAAGASLGAAFLSRPVEALAIGAVFGAALAADSRRAPRWMPLAAFGAAFLAVASIYLAFNAATTGHALRPGYVELWGSSHGLGFHEGPYGEPHTPSAGLRNGLLDLSLLGVFLFEWPIPALWPLGLALVAGWLTRRWDVLLVAAFLAVPAANFFYWHRDTFLGPRFLHVTVAFVLPLTARALVEGARRLAGRRWKPGGVPSIDLRRWAFLVLILAAFYAVAWGIPARFLIYRTSMESMKLDLVETARAAGVERALVFVSESWGSRVLAGLRGLGASAPSVEKAYRGADLCRLDGIVRQARAETWSPAAVEAALVAASVGPDSLVPVEIAGDMTARFRPGSRLTPECLAEIRYDEAGYALFTPHLPDDDPSLAGPLVFARDLGDHNTVLARTMPDREAWIYRGGRLSRWEPGR